MRNTCSLCGGKLKDGICTECGMDNRKSDAVYKSALNQSDCANMKFSHVHEDGKAQAYEKPRMNQTRKPEKEKSEDSATEKARDKGQHLTQRPNTSLQGLIHQEPLLRDRSRGKNP